MVQDRIRNNQNNQPFERSFVLVAPFPLRYVLGYELLGSCIIMNGETGGAANLRQRFLYLSSPAQTARGLGHAR